jgi:hypothetical protein
MTDYFMKISSMEWKILSEKGARWQNGENSDLAVTRSSMYGIQKKIRIKYLIRTWFKF